MKIVLASANKGKIREIREMLPEWQVVPYTDLLGAFDIEETGSTFQENAVIKAQTIYDRLGDPEALVLSDDSGISVPALDGRPGIYSARFAGKGASDRENLEKLIGELKERGIEETPAFYTCCMAVVCREGTYTVHGWMHGTAIPAAIGDGGFGYDPMFKPTGYRETIAQLPPETKEKLSHRTKALQNALVLIHALA